MEARKCTVIFLDVRNFTKQLSELYGEDSFIRLIEATYQMGLDVTSDFVKEEDFYLNSTGDGFVLIVFDELHYISAFCIALVLQKKLTELFEKSEIIEIKQEGNYYFGIGIESGEVKYLNATMKNKVVETYLGNVINVAARLESLTKEYARAPIIYGTEINELLVHYLFSESYKSLMKSAKSLTDAKDIVALHKKMSDYNSKLLSSYLFEHRLKGVNDAMPVFRISPTLFDNSKQSLKDFVSLLPQFYQEKIKSYLLYEAE